MAHSRLHIKAPLYLTKKKCTALTCIKEYTTLRSTKGTNASENTKNLNNFYKTGHELYDNNEAYFIQFWLLSGPKFLAVKQFSY